MQLSVSEVDDFNLLSHWLAENDLAEREIDDVQLIILAGNAILPEIEGAMALSVSAAFLFCSAAARDTPPSCCARRWPQTGVISNSLRCPAGRAICCKRWQYRLLVYRQSRC